MIPQIWPASIVSVTLSTATTGSASFDVAGYAFETSVSRMSVMGGSLIENMRVRPVRENGPHTQR